LAEIDDDEITGNIDTMNMSMDQDLNIEYGQALNYI